MFQAAAGRHAAGARALRAAAVVSLGLLAQGCASIGEVSPSALFASKADEEPVDPSAGPQSELQKATAYWGKEFSENPTDLDKALNYARNLKALGQKKQALGVLQQASMFHATDRRLNSEYGRLALELDQLPVAKKLLEAADDPARPDWRLLSARGTVLAKEGKHAEAIPLFEQALSISPNQTSVLNNLALAHAMNGEAARAEEVLRRITTEGNANAKVRQNLALVLGLQGKYDEATKVGSESGSPSNAAANTDIIKQIVRLEAKPFVPVPTGGGVWETTVADTAPGLIPAAAAAPDWQTRTRVAAAAAPALIPAPVAPAAPAPEAISADGPALRPSAP